MQVVTAELIKDKKVLLRLDLDVPIKEVGEDGLEVAEDFRLLEGMETLKLCLDQAQTTIIMGHIGRPEGKEVEELSVEPIYDWLQQYLDCEDLGQRKLRLLENLRFESGEEACDLAYAKELASVGDFLDSYTPKAELSQTRSVYINEAFAAYHPAASTTILPTLLPHAAGLHFAREVEVLTKVRGNPGKPLVVIIGGAKVENKLPLVLAMAKIADQVLVGGKITLELVRSSAVSLPANVLIGELNKEGTDIAEETVQKWKPVISGAKMIVWNGPLGKVEEDQNDQSKNIAQLIIKSGAESIIGGGDTITALNKWGLLNKFSFVSTGGGAMLKFLAEGTLPTIEALR
ncbi:MAG: Phosphoglycerate kinase [Candidatus Daviesbacteria bacterium GW2011_GWA1_41_61]|nr:MAG: Phosphoglycerate kinase [Candidatus Daviesbacteria bacterium GW2011_GWC1_40_9]KKR92361.1 MAG: Phosphoglycerate kinase [Candidatus Daviesbacteria bacterium GW2011_GWB1_41_15]KKS14549.1 MAG: Phosphoglycerate kinase [Candidatus Daviesbacteria bacterium GW2011_GWA1_41_61]